MHIYEYIHIMTIDSLMKYLFFLYEEVVLMWGKIGKITFSGPPRYSFVGSVNYRDSNVYLVS